jgi:hypothetical protein
MEIATFPPQTDALRIAPVAIPRRETSRSARLGIIKRMMDDRCCIVPRPERVLVNRADAGGHILPGVLYCPNSEVPPGKSMRRKNHVLALGLLAWLISTTAGLAAGRHSDRLTDIDRVLTANGYHGTLISGTHVATKMADDGSAFSITLWSKSPTDAHLYQARQIKFTQSYCESPGFSAVRFFSLAQGERAVFFRDVLGLLPPVVLDVDIQTLGEGETKHYRMPHVQAMRLTRRPLRCAGSGGEAYELDIFP